MDLFFSGRECLSRCFERKRTLAVFSVFFVAIAVLGACLCRTEPFFEYHKNAAARFVDNVCYSDAGVFVIFLKRTAANALLLLLVVAGGIHPVALFLPCAVLFYRAYTFGGGIVALISVYKTGGALLTFVLYLPIHLLIDAVLLLAFALTCTRARGFCFCKHDFSLLFTDFLTLFLLIAVVCLVEGLLLLALFHPLGNLL